MRKFECGGFTCFCVLLRQRQVGNFRDGVVVAQPTSDARFLALRALLAKVTMPTAARSNCDLAAEVARHGVDVIVSLLSGTESPVDRLNALPHAAKVASPRSRLWFLGRNVRGLSEVGAPSPPPAENRNGRRAPPTPVRLEDGPNLAPEAESFSPRHSEEDGPAAGLNTSIKHTAVFAKMNPHSARSYETDTKSDCGSEVRPKLPFAVPGLLGQANRGRPKGNLYRPTPARSHTPIQHIAVFFSSLETPARRQR